MQRFHPASRQNTLHDKVLKSLSDQRFMPPTARGVAMRIAASLGMDDEARAMLDRLRHLGNTRKTAIAGQFMPDGGISARLASLGITEHVEEADFFKYRAV